MPRNALSIELPEENPLASRYAEGGAAAETGSAIAQWIARQRDAWDERGRNMPPLGEWLRGAAGEYGNALLMGSTAPGMRAFHGSPHSFERFDTAKIGTGEGAQAYGHGLYFAEREGTARSYRDNLTVKPISPEVKAAQDAYNKAYWDVPTGGTQAEFDAAIAARDAAQANMRRVQDEWSKQPGPTGHMYEVNIGSDPEHFLHWDKPLSEQSKQVRQIIAKERPGLFTEGRYPDTLTAGSAATARGLPPGSTPIGDHNAAYRYGKPADEMTGQDYWHLMMRDAEMKPEVASAKLRELGLPGIRYLDQGSRGAGEGTHNLVVFNPENIEILRKYGLAGLGLGGAAAGAAQQSDGNQ